MTSPIHSLKQKLPLQKRMNSSDSDRTADAQSCLYTWPHPEKSNKDKRPNLDKNQNMIQQFKNGFVHCTQSFVIFFLPNVLETFK